MIDGFLQEKRTTVLAAAGRVGDYSQQVINTMDEPTADQTTFHDSLVQKAKNVATSTAQLVLRHAFFNRSCLTRLLCFSLPIERSFPFFCSAYPLMIHWLCRLPSEQFVRSHSFPYVPQVDLL